jgi:hypothetical protein
MFGISDNGILLSGFDGTIFRPDIGSIGVLAITDFAADKIDLVIFFQGKIVLNILVDGVNEAFGSCFIIRGHMGVGITFALHPEHGMGSRGETSFLKLMQRLIQIGSEIVEQLTAIRIPLREQIGAARSVFENIKASLQRSA